MQILIWLLGGLGKLLRGALGLIRDYPWQSAVIGLAIALLLMFRAWGIDHRDLTDQIGEANEMIAKERAAHLATIESVRKGREAARELDRQNAERVKAQAAAINERTIRELETRTRTYADRADRLRAQLSALGAGGGGGGTAPVPGDPDATCRALGAADCADLVARMTDAQGSIDKLLGLQAWASGVAAIDTNGAPE
ncbi:MAG: hypothetical protein ACT6Q7_02950 [Blastomonas fulva]|uniref:hypothetical protein n=1 Tax=Blastomonas fulva TaxID=1550728 RepID=UPI004033731D